MQLHVYTRISHFSWFYIIVGGSEKNSGNIVNISRFEYVYQAHLSVFVSSLRLYILRLEFTLASYIEAYTIQDIKKG